MGTRPEDSAFRAYLLRNVDVSERDLDKLIAELRSHWGETPAEFVRRRHRELQRQGARNPAIYEQVAAEIQGRRFSASPLTERQIRRLIYG